MNEKNAILNAAVVTGAASGIGLATSLRLASDGYHILCADLEGRGNIASEKITQQGGSAEAVDLKVQRREDWVSLFTQLKEREMVLSALVNNAGITRDRTLLKMTDREFEAVIDVHLKGSWLGCQVLLPLMRDTSNAAIVNISSTGRHGAFGQSNYASAKAGIVGLTKTIAIEAARYGVRCNAVAPGTVKTPMLDSVPEDTKQGWLDTIALGRFAEPEEIASAISFLLSKDASFITGHVLDVNGLEHHP